MPSPGTQDLRERALRLGWLERADLPEFGLYGIEAKLDTGARICALDGEIAWTSGAAYLTAARLGLRHHPVLPMETRRVRASNGVAERRPILRTTLVLAGRARAIRLSITRRERMTVPLLVGRAALEGILVDPSATHLATSPNASFGASPPADPSETSS